jgi:hypothetical protein
LALELALTLEGEEYNYNDNIPYHYSGLVVMPHFHNELGRPEHKLSILKMASKMYPFTYFILF